MITCSRCGKENQKHYKFCLGCGAKLEAPAPEVTRPVEPVRGAESPLLAAVPRMTGAGAAVSSSASVAPVPSYPAELAPTAESPILPMANHARNSAVAMAVVESLSPSRDALPDPTTNPGPPSAVVTRDMIPCPKCGKTVVSSYAFCGACGYRMKPGAAGAAPAAAARSTGAVSSVVKTAPRGHLTLIRPDGTEGGVHSLQDGENLIGRGQGSLFDADPYLSPRHAEFAFTSEGLVVRDLRSLNGVFIKIVTEEPLESGDILRIGQELLRFDVITTPSPLEDGTEVIGTPNPGYWGRVSVIVGRDVEGPAFPLYDDTVVLGRERGDILFPEDGYVSGRHAQIVFREGQATLTDLGSSNGTFFRIRGSRAVPAGTLLLMGQQLFRASYR